MNTIAEFQIKYRQYLPDDMKQTTLLHQPPEKSADWDFLVAAYRQMVLTRCFDRKAIALQRTGRMGTYPSCLGQEAIGVAAAMAMQDEDVFVPGYRDQAAQLVRGVSMVEVFQYWGGDERGSDFKNCRQDFPNCVPVATQLTHGAGVASAIKIKGEKRAVVASCGDGATSRGDFYEAINVAGAWQLPLVVLVSNNQWSISVPRELQSAAVTLAQKAIAAGIPGEQVDGNDVIAVHAAISEALERARAGKGATLIEAMSYRLSDHTTADDATRYRDSDKVNAAWEREPIKRLQNYLYNNGKWNPELERKLIEECEQKVKQAVADFEALSPQQPQDMFEFLFSEWPCNNEFQQRQLEQKLSNNEAS